MKETTSTLFPTELSPESKPAKLNRVKKVLRNFLLFGVMAAPEFFGPSIDTKKILEEDQLLRKELTVGLKFIEKDINKGNPLEDFDVGTIETAEGNIGIEDIRKYLATFPQNWIKGEVASIKQVDAFCVDEAGNEYEDIFATYNYTNNEINFYKKTKGLDKRENLRNLAHEVSHANDALSDKDMSTEDRIELALQLYKRIKSRDRFSTYYIERLLRFGAAGPIVIREYWAEICGEYFTNPSNLNINDFILVDKFVKKSDANYDWQKSLKERRALIQ